VKALPTGLAITDPQPYVQLAPVSTPFIRAVLCLLLIFSQAFIHGCKRYREAGAICDFSRGGTCTLKVDEVTREYVLHVPQNFQPGKSALVIVLHGSRGSGPRMEKMSGFDPLADQNGFAVAFPSALDNNTDHSVWNVYFNSHTFSPPPDDVAFLRQLIQTLREQLRVDPNRIYIVGFSNGGYMAHRAGVELSDLVAAIGVVDGSLYVIPPGQNSIVPQPHSPVSAVIVHGTDDQPVKYCGAVTNGATTASQDQSFEFWSGANGCESVTSAAPLCITGQVNASVPAKRANACRRGSAVEIYPIIHGQHVWYDRLNNLPGPEPYNSALTEPQSTAQLLWHFFETHPRQ
jgi:polyhydroxybutyrate depolymerase